MQNLNSSTEILHSSLFDPGHLDISTPLHQKESRKKLILPGRYAALDTLLHSWWRQSLKYIYIHTYIHATITRIPMFARNIRIFTISLHIISLSLSSNVIISDGKRERIAGELADHACLNTMKYRGGTVSKRGCHGVYNKSLNINRKYLSYLYRNRSKGTPVIKLFTTVRVLLVSGVRYVTYLYVHAYAHRWWYISIVIPGYILLYAELL